MSAGFKERYKCPECASEDIRFKFKVNNNDNKAPSFGGLFEVIT